MRQHHLGRTVFNVFSDPNLLPSHHLWGWGDRKTHLANTHLTTYCTQWSRQSTLGTSSNPSDSILCLWMPSHTATEEWHVAAQPCWGSELRANRIRPSRPGELLFCRREGLTVPGASSAPLGAGEAELQNPAQQEACTDQPCRESNLALLMRVFKEFNHSTTLLRSYPRLQQSNLLGYSPQCKLYQHQTEKPPNYKPHHRGTGPKCHVHIIEF